MGLIAATANGQEPPYQNPEWLQPETLPPGLISENLIYDSGDDPLPFSVGPLAPGPMIPLGPVGQYDEFLPQEILYPAYLAGPKESRIGTQVLSESQNGMLWDTTLGGRFGVYRTTSLNGQRIWQLDFEGAAILRLDPREAVDLENVDFRAGAPIALVMGPHRFKFGYEHISAHIGDEYLIRVPTFTRLNYSRDSLMFGYSRYLSERVRVYGEADWAFSSSVSAPWQLQFGFEYAPTRATGTTGEPFFAINALLREEVNFSGTTTVHTGWAWREPKAGRLLRAGFFFQTGKSHHYEFYDTSETQVGAGVWFDY